MKLAYCLLTLAMTTGISAEAAQPLPYRDSTLTVAERVADLLGRMTLEEKVAQLQCRWQEKTDFLTEGRFDAEKARRVMPDGIGSLARMNEDFTPGYQPWFSTHHAREGAELYNAIQRYMVEQTRLGIPVLNHEECLHGLQAKDATNFPMPIALASSWNPELIREVYEVVARESRSRGAGQVLGPVVDITQDPRWGRTEETMGEDPYLNSVMGCAMVKALQGDGETIDNQHVATTLKHLGIHGRSEGGINTAPSYIDEYTAREQHLKPFSYIIRKAKPANVMVSYPEFGGERAHSNHHLVTDILRGDWGFEGLVVSDYGGISNLQEADHVVESMDTAGVMGLMAGVDVELPSIKAFANLAQMVREGIVPESRLDEAVGRILAEKFRLGLFEHPYVDPDHAVKIAGCRAHRDVALKAAEQSMVLLQNRDDILPLNTKDIKTIAVIGPNAAYVSLGGYSNFPLDTITPLEGIRERAAREGINVVYAQGARIAEHPLAEAPSVVRERTAAENAELRRQAVETARMADVVVLCLGENDSIHRECMGPVSLGDMPTLELLGGQKELVAEIAALGKPMVALNFSGTTLNLAPVAQAADAVVQCWYLGEETGTAVAEMLFGDIAPSGKLTISFPRSAGHIPAIYNHKPLGTRGYNMGYDISPLYPFGYGLTYTNFTYSEPRLDRGEITTDEVATISVDVTNAGKRAGDEIVQLYITDDYARLPRPCKELRGFKRVHLEPGETATVTFPVGCEQLEYLNADFQPWVEPGTFTLQVGPSSAEGKTATLTVKK